MGVVTNCCTKQTIIQSASISIYSLSEEDLFNYNEIGIPTISDKDHAFKFITSNEYYPLLLKNIPKNIITKKICQKLNNADIFSLINNLFEWIKKEELVDCDKDIKNNIILIKNNAKISLNYILKELNNIQFNEKIEIYIVEALTNISLIIQCLLFLFNKFNLNIWENKNIIEEAKKYGFQASYFLLLIKKKYINNPINNINNIQNDENKITNEKKGEVNLFYKVSLDFTSNIINAQ